MKKVLVQLISVLGFVVHLSACSFGGGSGAGDGAGSKGAADGNGQPGQDSSGGDLTINGVSANEFYGKFVSRPVLNCEKQSASGYRSVRADYIALEKTSEGHKVRGEFEATLDADGNFTALYKEFELLQGNGSLEARKLLYSTELAGKWSIQQGELVIGDIGRGMGGSYNGMNIINFKFLRDLSKPGLKGQFTFLGIINRELSAEEFEAKCDSEANSGS
jgi:hypothetical protein